MRVELRGHTLTEARSTAHKFLAGTIPDRTFPVPKRIEQIERERMRQKRAGTRKARRAIEDMLGDLRARIRAAVPLREADTPDAEAEKYRKMQAALLDEMAGIPTDLLATTLSPILDELLQQGRASSHAELGLGFEVKHTQAIDALYRLELKFSKMFVEREMAAVKDILLSGLDQGLPAREVAKEIRDQFADGIHYVGDDGKIERTMPDEAWADMVARTETSRAHNMGVYSTYLEQGVSFVRWLAADDERTCVEICLPLDGEVAQVGQPFAGTDIVMPPDSHVMCRCSVVADWSFLDGKYTGDA